MCVCCWSLLVYKYFSITFLRISRKNIVDVFRHKATICLKIKYQLLRSIQKLLHFCTFCSCGNGLIFSQTKATYFSKMCANLQNGISAPWQNGHSLCGFVICWSQQKVMKTITGCPLVSLCWRVPYQLRRRGKALYHAFLTRIILNQFCVRLEQYSKLVVVP